jgi:hypothetical protein
MGAVKTSDMCAWGRCVNKETVWEVTFSTECQYHRVEKMCNRHGKRIDRNRADIYTCTCSRPRDLYFSSIRPLPRPEPEVQPYHEARKAWLEHGWLADKDKMVDAVTLTVPSDWDVYGNIMADTPKPAVRRLPSRQVVAVAAVFTIMLIAAFLFGAII